MKPLSAIRMVSIVIGLWSTPGLANVSYTPWIHSLIQKGQDVEVTINVFEDASVETFREVPFPSFEVPYTLTRWGGPTPGVTLLEDVYFHRDAAVSSSGYACQTSGDSETDCGQTPDACIDCDDDGVPECPGFCAVAYRYTVIDKCVPPSDIYYSLTSSTLEEQSQEFLDMEGFGHQSAGVLDSGDACLDFPDGQPDKEGCAVIAVGLPFERAGSAFDFVTLVLNID